MEELERFQEELAEKYGYKKLSAKLSQDVRNRYWRNLPEELKLGGDSKPLYTLVGTKIAEGYERIVIGDYGAFIEISESQIVKENIELQKGQEYRYTDARYRRNAKYYWLTAKDGSGVKIYLQKKTVSYASYQVGWFYVSQFAVSLKNGR